MAQPILQRLCAWLCLVLTIFAGIAPAQGFVLCIEADGCISFELKTPAANCDGCVGHDDDAVEPGNTRGGASTVTEHEERAPRRGACPCIDLAVPGAPEAQRVPSRALELDGLSWMAVEPAAFVTRLIPCRVPVRGPLAAVPRAPDLLTHIRSVVLLV